MASWGPEQSDELEKSTMRRVAWRFLPVIVVTYFVAYVDRVNIGMVKAEMSHDIGLTSVGFGLASGLIFIGLILFEVPSNRMALRFGARKWITRIMLSWGLVVIATSLVQTPGHLYIARVLLGLGEAGMAPALFLFLGQWFPGRHRAAAFSALFLSIPIAMAFGSPLTGWLLESTHDALGLPGWRWVFLIEGAAALAVAPLVFILLADTPARAGWLREDQRAWLDARLAEEHEQRKAGAPHSFWRALTDRRVLLLSAIFLLLGYGTNAMVYWLPTIVRNATVNLSPLRVGLVSATPFVVAAGAIVLVGYVARRVGNRRSVLLAPVLVSLVGFVGAMLLLHQIVFAMALICLALGGALAAQPQFWTLPTGYLTGASAAGGIAMINSVNNVGGFAAPYTFGWLTQASGGSALPFLVMASAQALAAILIVVAYRRRGPAVHGAGSPGSPGSDPGGAGLGQPPGRRPGAALD
ncbi:MFS transporter [Pseudonocardia acaciae]|uniref:MFS transporter n=1 Tax=Pseudonocardia acaciae TaxID=551276 RepID=UPI000688B95C|nr:MFS transporter [Pseudonocardia acaciae]